jgi:hypothetical protein
MSLFEAELEIVNPFLPDAPMVSRVRKNKAITKQGLRKESAKEILTKAGGLPVNNTSFDCITNGQSNAGGFYEVIRDEWGQVECLCIATWIINRYYIDLLLNDLKTGKLKKLVFILSNRMKQLTHHKPHFNYLISQSKDIDNCYLRICKSHAKTYSMTNGIDYITIDGSGNWSENPRIENYTITNNKEKFDFRYNWMMELMK